MSVCLYTEVSPQVFFERQFGGDTGIFGQVFSDYCIPRSSVGQSFKVHQFRARTVRHTMVFNDVFT